MLYKFKSQATGDLIMLEPNGDALLRVLGRQPAAKGIIEVADMPQALRAIEAAIAADEAARQLPQPGECTPDDPQGQDDPKRGVSLRQRFWPMVEMLRRAQAAREPVVWGV